jgi:hypothetical protein
LAAGPWLVTDAALADEILVTHPERYEDQSAFLRTRSHNPLPSTVRDTLVAGMLTAFRSSQLPPVDAVIDGFTASRRDLPLQGFGARFYRRFFAPVLAFGRSAGLEALLDRYVEEIVVRDATAGEWPSRAEARLRSLRRAVAAELAHAPTRTSDPCDLVDVVGLVAGHLPPVEVAELYLRLVLSVVGFTGTALEWTLLSAAGERLTGVDRTFVLETQRRYPTSWRLLRTAQVDHDLAGRPIAAGDAVIIATYLLHQEGTTFLPFGRGPGACPARGIALAAVTDAAAALLARFTIEADLRRRGRPHVLTLLGAPAGTLRLSANPAARCPFASGAAAP